MNFFKSIHYEYSIYFFKYETDNYLFKIVYEHFAQNDSKPYFSEMFSSFSKIRKIEDKKYYLITFFKINQEYFHYVVDSWVSQFEKYKVFKTIKLIFEIMTF